MGLELSEAVNKEKKKRRERDWGKETEAWLTPPDCGREGISASGFLCILLSLQARCVWVLAWGWGWGWGAGWAWMLV